MATVLVASGIYLNLAALGRASYGARHEDLVRTMTTTVSDFTTSGFYEYQTPLKTSGIDHNDQTICIHNAVHDGG